jgi:hypothetical protein
MKSLIVLFAILFSGHAYSTTNWQAYCGAYTIIIDTNNKVQSGTKISLSEYAYNQFLWETVKFMEKNLNAGKHYRCSPVRNRLIMNDVFNLACQDWTKNETIYFKIRKSTRAYVKLNAQHGMVQDILKELDKIDDAFVAHFRKSTFCKK